MTLNEFRSLTDKEFDIYARYIYKNSWSMSTVSYRLVVNEAEDNKPKKEIIFQSKYTHKI